MFEPPRPIGPGGRKGTATISLLVHATVIGASVVIPMTQTSVLPPYAMVSATITPPPPVREAALEPIDVVDAAGVPAAEPDIPRIDREAMIEPEHIPDGVAALIEEPPVSPRPVRGTAGFASGDAIRGIRGVIGSRGDVRPNRPPPPAPPPPPPPLLPRSEPERIRVSAGAVAGHLIHRVDPVYPDLARRAGVEGQITLEGVISVMGTVEELRVVEGHPLLLEAATTAVRQWRYEPFLLNGKPIDVTTLFLVTFRLN
jgi:protein TonB